jgi:hypothetical protein
MGLLFVCQYQVSPDTNVLLVNYREPDRTRRHLLKLLAVESYILELSCQTADT